MPIISCSSFFALSLILALPAVTGSGSQGLEGHVYRVSGNQMPSPDRPPAPPRGTQTTIYIFQLTNLSQVTAKKGSPFYSAISTKLVRKVETDSSGYFKISIPEGRYSLFVRVNGFYFANTFDGENNISPFSVTRNHFTPVNFMINYNAHY